jgi:hypothetical protein
VVFTLTASRAQALEQSKHRDISENACKAAGLSANFCGRVGDAAYNVDWAEWDTLAAHAQPEAGQSLCDAAGAAAARLSSLGGEISAALELPASAERANTLADAMGRALHTLQDNCAHEGVSNVQHAWYSLSDSCDGTKLSPDVQPQATQCANLETELVMDEFANALYYAGVTNSELTQADEVSTHWPPRGGVCEFLKGADDWDGVDVRWDDSLVTPALRESFLSGIYGTATTPDFCAVSGLEIPNPKPTANTSGGADWCVKLNLYCIGKGDAPDEAPPWVAAADPAPATNTSSDSGGSCALVAGKPAGGGGA